MSPTSRSRCAALDVSRGMKESLPCMRQTYTCTHIHNDNDNETVSQSPKAIHPSNPPARRQQQPQTPKLTHSTRSRRSPSTNHPALPASISSCALSRSGVCMMAEPLPMLKTMCSPCTWAAAGGGRWARTSAVDLDFVGACDGRRHQVNGNAMRCDAMQCDRLGGLGDVWIGLCVCITLLGRRATTRTQKRPPVDDARHAHEEQRWGWWCWRLRRCLLLLHRLLCVLI